MNMYLHSLIPSDMGNLVTLEETHMKIYAGDKINEPASKRNAALFPTIWPTSSKTHLVT